MVKEASLELLHKIVHMYDVERKGYRRIGKELVPPQSKDTIMRLYRRAKAQGINAEISSPPEVIEGLKQMEPEKEPMDRELKRKQKLKEQLETEAIVLKAKREMDERICDLLDDKYTNDYKARCELFNNPQKMWEFTETVLSVNNPQLLDDFKSYVKLHKPCGTRDFPKLISKFLNSYTQKRDYENKFDSLAAYVETKISDYLSLWKYHDKERLRRKSPLETIEVVFIEQKKRPFSEELAEAVEGIREIRKTYEKCMQEIKEELAEEFRRLI